jgi:hypothetical protein
VTVLTDSRYAALARTAAAALGASSPEIARAILSQWQCEGQSHWPPVRNNPGNIARGLATSLGLAFTVTTPNPQPGNPIVSYASPSIGATAYAKAIATQSRYGTVLRAARAGDGLAFVRAMGSSGWGTGSSCMLGVYRGKGAVGGGPNLPTGSGSSGGGSTPPPPSSSPTGGSGSSGGIIQAVYPVKLASSCTQVTILSPGWGNALSNLGAFPIPSDEVGKPCVQCADGWEPAVVTKADGYDWLNGWTDPATLPAGTPNACVKAGMKDGQMIGPLGVPGTVADAARTMLDLSNLGPMIVNLGVLGIAAYLVLSGVRDVLGDAPQQAAIAATDV